MNKVIRKKLVFILIFVLVIISYYYSYNVTINNLSENLKNTLEFKFRKDNILSYKFDFLSFSIDYIKNSYLIYNSKEETVLNEVLYNSKEPTIYIYNTHYEEEYSYIENGTYNIIPTVATASLILQSELKNLGIYSVVEKTNTIEVLNKRKLPYSSSYKISREFLENSVLENKSLNYFIDLHRDSVKRNITTVEINNKIYAKVMFLLGLENPNYQENQKLMTYLNNYLEENYQGLSRGIYEKQGKGVNGVYNQDFNKNTILIEVGGFQNNIEEVSNTIKVIASCLYDYILKNDKIIQD